jgi:hypothetical protein
MRRRDIRGLVAPNRPGAERNLANDQRDPKVRQTLEHGDVGRISPNPQAKCNYPEGN